VFGYRAVAEGLTGSTTTPKDCVADAAATRTISDDYLRYCLLIGKRTRRADGTGVE
jgi:hypothetical protein